MNAAKSRGGRGLAPAAMTLAAGRPAAHIAPYHRPPATAVAAVA